MTTPTKNQPLVALRALMTLAGNPDDLPAVFRLIGALPGRSPARTRRRMRTIVDGRRLLATRPNIGARLADRAALLALPRGTLGHTYAELAERAGITPQGIVDASVAGHERPAGLDAEDVFLGDRMRDTHDLWHAVTGYGFDVVGELALLAFTYAQTRHPGVALICGYAVFQRVPEVTALMRSAYRRGKTAVWFPAVVWEDILDRPLDEVRALLDVGAAPVYTPITTEELRAAGRLPAPA